MKKVFFLMVLLATILPVPCNAQKFWSSDELRVELKVWDSIEDVDYLVENGKPVSWTYNYGIGNPVGFNVFCTYPHQGKFITLTFANDTELYLCEQSRVTNFSSISDMFGYLSYLPYFSGFDYSKIVYDIWWNRILIPIGTDESTGQSYAISIYFDNGAGINQVYQDSIPENFDQSKVRYYNIQGREVDVDTFKGQMLIKTDGKKSYKFFNK